MTALFRELLSSHVPLFAEESVASNHKIGSGIVDEAELVTNTPTFFDTNEIRELDTATRKKRIFLSSKSEIDNEKGPGTEYPRLT